MVEPLKDSISRINQTKLVLYFNTGVIGLDVLYELAIDEQAEAQDALRRITIEIQAVAGNLANSAPTRMRRVFEDPPTESNEIPF